MSDNLVARPIVRATALTKQVSTGDEQLTILEDINLEVNAGDSVAVIGASGSGKSTLLGLLAGLVRRRAQVGAQGYSTRTP